MDRFESGFRPPALVLGRGITALGTLRSLARSGLTTFVAGNEDGWVASSRWYRVPQVTGAATLLPAGLAGFLATLPFPRVVLFPCSDEWVAAVAELPAEAAGRCATSLAPRESLRVFLDKARFAQVLDRLELPHPRTVFPLDDAELQRLPSQSNDHLFLKPRRSQAFCRQYGTKAFRFGTPSEAAALLESARRAGHELMLQEYIPGPPGCHHFIDGFVDAAGRLSAIFARRRLRMHPPDFGNSTYMVSVPPLEVAGAARSLERLFGEVGYRGIFSAEFKYDQRDDRFKILEVNVRPWWYVEFAARAGVNVCAMAYRDALGLPVEPVERYAVGRRCVYPHDDSVVGVRLWREGRLSLASLARSWLGADQPVLCWDDPLPGIASLVIWLRDRLLGGAA